jgi:hypothetical protein
MKPFMAIMLKQIIRAKRSITAQLETLFIRYKGMNIHPSWE